MDKSLSLRSNRDFQKVYKRGKAYYNRNFSLIVYKSNNGSRIGFSVTKKYGNAVERNRIKRRLREIVRLNRPKFEKGLDMVIIPKKNTGNLNYSQLESSLLHVVRKVDNKNEKNRNKAN
ncbi:MAG: ribonuclease P protein component [Finegoldia sp.]|nr:ribonuclease P protein component [Finegoldia sp.]